MRLGIADKRAHVAHDALANAGGVAVVLARQHARERRVTKQLAVRVHRLGDAVGVQHDDVSRQEGARIFHQDVGKPLAGARQPQAQHHAVRHDDLAAAALTRQ